MTFDSDNENKNEETPTRRRRRTPRRRAAAQLQDGQMDASTEDMPHLQEIPSTMPLLPLRDVVVFNYMIVPLFVGREQSVQAVEAAATQGRHIFLCAQKDGQVDNPTAEDLYPLGSVALILRLLKTPDGRIKALVQGVSRARLVALYEEGSHMTAKVELLPEPEATAPEAEQEALTR
ncbi:MAG: LON peptidase substrate-binding domain-containing protein, partial [Bilophila sp.]